MQLVALRELDIEEEMTFFYPSTEWEMTQSFSCYCGSPACIGEIRGAAFYQKILLHNIALLILFNNNWPKRRQEK